MFQTFDSPSSPGAASSRIDGLRKLLEQLGLEAFIVPRADEHQGEYVPASAERLSWLTGFTGSAGNAVIGRQRAALFVDGRYRVQARAQVDNRLIEIVELPGHPTAWIGEALPTGAVVGFDPWLMTAAQVERTATALADKKIRMKPVARNPVDRLWGRERPEPPAGAVVPHPIACAGRSASDKIEALQKRLVADGHDAVLLTATDSVSWLFNIRGHDVPHTPVVLAFALVPRTGKPELFVAAAKIGAAAKAHLAPIVKLQPPEALQPRLKELRRSGRKVRLNPATAAFRLEQLLGGKRSVARASDPVTAMKAVKNDVEIRGARSAHLRDGAAVTRFLAWLDGEAGKGRLDEITAVERLEAFRRDTGALKEISFDTISGSGPNGAIVHYRVTRETNRRLGKGELFLIDSGGQYEDGTTDITRTVAIGKPSEEMRERFTLVLKGHIAIATARFPTDTRGIDLDPFARRALWAAGLDYDHGTGHGVGSFLSVHEGPQSISRGGMEKLVPGMILSNEPGYYKDGAYGIRIENLVLVRTAERPPGGERNILEFETLTLAPIDRRLVVKGLLCADERAWLDVYHARVRTEVGPLLDAAQRAWLEAATRPI
jgi:Xaa-Pro aminopeptidase